MVADAITGDRMIGMVLLRPGWEQDYEGRPPVYPIGCSGVITHVEQLADGRYNIVLRGFERFRILEEDHALSYRRAVVERLTEQPMDDSDRAARPPAAGEARNDAGRLARVEGGRTRRFRQRWGTRIS